VATAVAFIVGVGIGSGSDSGAKTSVVAGATGTVTVAAPAVPVTPPAPAAKTVTKTVAAPAPAARTVTKTVTAAAPAPDVPASGPNTISDDGIYTVGADIAIGTYRVTAAASSDCYWSITKSGSNGGDIIENNLGGGFPRVTLKAGQDFTTTSCGSWAKL
jgi:hypothetical protein